MQKKGIGMLGQPRKHPDPFFRIILSNFSDRVNHIPLRAKKKATRPVIGWRAFRRRFGNLELDLHSSHHAGRRINDKELIDEGRGLEVLVEEVPHRQHELPLGTIPSDER